LNLVAIVIAPTTTATAAHCKVSADVWAVFVVFAEPRRSVKPEARVVQLSFFWRLVGSDVFLELDAKIFRERNPVRFCALCFRTGYISWVTHVKTTDATAIAVIDGGQRILRHGLDRSPMTDKTAIVPNREIRDHGRV
jgi:hypothetical protein